MRTRPGLPRGDASRLLRRGGRSHEERASPCATAVVCGGIPEDVETSAQASNHRWRRGTAASDCRGRPGPRPHDPSLAACAQEAGDAARQQPQRARSEHGTHQRNDQQPGSPVGGNVNRNEAVPAPRETIRCAAATTDAGGSRQCTRNPPHIPTLPARVAQASCSVTRPSTLTLRAGTHWRAEDVRVRTPTSATQR